MVNTKGLTALQKRYLFVCENGRCLTEGSLISYASGFRVFNRFLADYEGSSSFTPQLMIDYLKYLKTVKRYSKHVIRSRLILIKAYTSWLHKTGLLDDWPFSNGDIRLPHPKPNPRPLNRSQVAKLSSHTRGPKWWCEKHDRKTLSRKALVCNDITINLAIRMMIATGMRIGELTHLKIPDVRYGGSEIRVLGKGDVERILFIVNEDLQEDVSLYLAGRKKIELPHPYFLLNAWGRRLQHRSIQAQIRRIRKEIGDVDGITAHRLRHTTATLLYENGADLLAIQKLLGHAKIETTQKYTFVTDDALRKTLRETDPLDPNKGPY